MIRKILLNNDLQLSRRACNDCSFYFLFFPIFSASSIVSGSDVFSVSLNSRTVHPDAIANPPNNRTGKSGTYLAWKEDLNYLIGQLCKTFNKHAPITVFAALP